MAGRRRDGGSDPRARRGAAKPSGDLVDRQQRRAEFRPRPGSRITKEAAVDVGSVIYEQLVPEGRGTARDLLDAARDPRSPAHRHFEWDDQVAAEKHRLATARQFFRSIAVVIEEVDSRPIPAFERIDYEDDEQRTHSRYEPIDTVRTSAPLMRQVLDRARSELLVWVRKYRRYRTMAKQFGILDEVFETLETEFRDAVDGHRR